MNNLHGRRWRISLTRLEHGKAEGWISFQSLRRDSGMQRRTRGRSDAAAPRPFAYDLAANAASRVTPLTFQSTHVKTESSLSSSDGLLVCQSSASQICRATD